MPHDDLQTFWLYRGIILHRILIVDDEDEVRKSIERRLERDGLELDTASGEKEGIEKIENAEKPYDVVLTDMVMENPHSGINVLQAALGNDIFTEVIVLTAYGNIANAVECMKRGAFDYVEKNIPGIDVYELVSRKVAQAIEHREESLGTIKRLDNVSKNRDEWGKSGDWLKTIMRIKPSQADDD